MPTYRACRDSGVGELGASGEVGPGDPERSGPAAVQALPAHLGVGPAEPGDLQGVAVGQGAAVRVDLGVEPGPDQVADPRLVAIGQRGPSWADRAQLGEPGLDAAGQFGGLGVGPGQQQHVLAAQMVGQPHGCGAVVGGVLVGAADAAVPVVGGDRGRVAIAEPEAGLPLPRRTEPADLVQLRGPDFPGQEPEHARGLDRAELGGVPGDDDPRSGLPGRLGDHGQVRGGELAGLIQHQHVVLVQRDGAAQLVGAFGLAEEGGDVVGLG